MSPPETPLFAGTPTVNSQSPAESYMPQVAMTLKTARTVRSEATRTPVKGFTPPFARVAAMVARSRPSMVTEHCAK